MRREEGQFGVMGVLLMVGITLATLYVVYTMNRTIVSMAWKGFITYMQPDYLYPTLSGDYGSNNGKNVLLGAVYLNQEIVIRRIVNPLMLLILLFMGMAYVYSDVFEQLAGKLKGLLPRVVFALILAYASIYIFQALMIIAKAGYVIFYNEMAMGGWKREDYLFRIAPYLKTPYSNVPGVSELTHLYWQYIWVFIILVEAISLLIFLAFRMVLLGILLVLLPIGSVLLVHPWTQRIGARMWWLTISLIFVPIAMIIPLMLSTLVEGSVSFVIASLAAVLGSIYLISMEPTMLSGLGFQKAGTMLTGGVTGAAATGNILAGMDVAKGKDLSGGIKDKLDTVGSVKNIWDMVDKVRGREGKGWGKASMGQAMVSEISVDMKNGNISIKQAMVSLNSWVESRGGLKR